MMQHMTRWIGAGCAALIVTAGAHAVPITGNDIVAVPDGVVGSGNGTLDLRLFTFSGSEIGNDAGAFDGDNANTELPNSGGGDNSSFAESYITTAGKLQAYYDLNFGPGSVNQIVLYLDLNETGGGGATNTLTLLDIIANPATVQGNPDPLNSDVPGSDKQDPDQAGVQQTYTGGTLLAELDPAPAANLPLVAQGAGFADYAIFTGINPYSLNASDVILFNLSMDNLSNGAEQIFLSGTFAAGDVPEPGSLALLALGALAILAPRRRCASRGVCDMS